MNIKNRPILAMMILALSALLVVSQLYIPIPLIGLFSQTFQVTPATAVWIGSGFGFAYAAGFLVFGPLSDHLGRRNLLIPANFSDREFIYGFIGFANSPRLYCCNVRTSGFSLY